MPSPPAARVTSRQNPLVTRFRDAARQRGGPGDPLLIEGATLVAEAHAGGWSIEVAAFTDKALAHHEVARLFETLAPGVPCVIAAEPVVEAMSPARTPSGVVALATPRRWTLDEVLAHDGALAVVAVGVQDPGNVGAIVRAAEAAGSTGVIASGVSADPFGWKALRGAMGSAFRLPVVRVPDANDVLRACRARGLRVIATALDGTPAGDVALDVPSAVLVGAEGTGLPQPLIDAADMRLTIPMQPPVQSLNVAVAAGIILYEARRQRALAGGRR